MSKSPRSRPEVESLSAKLLLSAGLSSGHHAAAGPVALSGTFRLTSIHFKGLPIGSSSQPASDVLVGSGSLGKFGQARVILEGVGTPPGTIVGVAGRRTGYIALGSEIAIPGKGASTTGPYSVIDANDAKLSSEVNPTGTLTISGLAAKGGKPSYTLKLS